MITNILKFGADWCGPCKTLHKNLEPIMDMVREIDVEEDEDLADKYGIRNIPVLVFLDEADEEQGRLIGAVSLKVVQDKIAELNGK